MRNDHGIANFLSGVAMGALICWGLMYDALTSAKPGVTFSSWAQVLVAGVVGWAAVAVPKSIAEREGRRRKEVFVALLLNALMPARSLMTALRADPPVLSPALFDAHVKDLHYQLAALVSVPAAEAPSADLLALRAEAEAQCRVVLGVAPVVFEWHRGRPPPATGWQQAEALVSYIEDLERRVYKAAD